MRLHSSLEIHTILGAHCNSVNAAHFDKGVDSDTSTPRDLSEIGAAEAVPPVVKQIIYYRPCRKHSIKSTEMLSSLRGHVFDDIEK
jgi:hypothetical protein